MKILVVDDELVSRKKMQMIMEGIGECLAVENGTEALNAFRQAWESWVPFDLITLDIVMPDMDGTEVLNEIRKIEEERKIPKDKKVSIFMVTSQSEKDTIISCIRAGCDDFITKPFNRETVTKKLINKGFKVEGMPPEGDKPEEPVKEKKGIEKKGEFIESIINRFKRGEIDLPSMPRIHARFKELVDKGATLQNIAELLRQDAAITTKLINISNSSYYRGLVENKTLESAISRLGLETTKQTVSAIANRKMYTTNNKKYAQIVENLWLHSLSCAYASQVTASTARVRLEEDPFTLGLLHDIGKLILIQVVGEAEKRTQAANEDEVLEMFNALDAYHGKTGSILLKKWGFSERYILVSDHHHSLPSSENITKELQVVHFSNLLVKHMGFGRTEPFEVDLETAETAVLLNMDAGKIASIKAHVQEQMESTRQYIE